MQKTGDRQAVDGEGGRAREVLLSLGGCDSAGFMARPRDAFEGSGTGALLASSG